MYRPTAASLLRTSSKWIHLPIPSRNGFHTASPPNFEKALMNKMNKDATAPPVLEEVLAPLTFVDALTLKVNQDPFELPAPEWSNMPTTDCMPSSVSGPAGRKFQNLASTTMLPKRPEEIVYTIAMNETYCLEWSSERLKAIVFDHEHKNRVSRLDPVVFRPVARIAGAHELIIKLPADATLLDRIGKTLPGLVSIEKEIIDM